MGKRAVLLFEQAEQAGGLRAKIALAVLTRIPSTEAAGAPDTPDLLARLERGLATVRQQYARQEQSAVRRGVELRAEAVPQPAPIGSAEVALRRHVHTYLELMSQRSLLLGDVERTIQRITEASSHALDVERVSVWYVDAAVSKITCADLYQRTEQAHSEGLVLSGADYKPYFAALRDQRTIAAHDAHTDPRTSCFSQGYLAPLRIFSMLDVPIWVADSMVGVICHEQVGAPRTWTEDEENFAYLMSSFVSLTVELARGGPKSVPSR